MLGKVLVVIVAVTVVSCEEQLYRLKSVFQHEAPKEYRHHPYQHFALKAHQVTEPSSEEQHAVQENHGHAYSSQSVIHHGPAAAYEESHEANNQHVAPVYQYVNEQSVEPDHHHVSIKQKYHAVHYPASNYNEVQPEEVPHQEVQAHYQTNSHEGFSYQHEAPQHVPQHVSHHQVPVHHQEASQESHEEPIDYYAYPKYQYEYKVEDPHTGDNKFQHEFRDGDVVKGIYGLHEADGSIRTVEYSSDKHSGFNAIVKHSAPGHHVQIESHHQN